MRFLVIGALMIGSMYILVGFFWWMHAARRSGFRARDVIFGPLLVLPLVTWPCQIAWRYTAKSMYWSPRPEHKSQPLFAGT
jgi:hypothetical protein